MVQFSCGTSHQSVNREAFISQFPSHRHPNPNHSLYLTRIVHYFENSHQIFGGKITSVRREPKKQQSSKHPPIFWGFPISFFIASRRLPCCTVMECLVTHIHSIKETHLPETLTYGKVKQHSFPC